MASITVYLEYKLPPGEDHCLKKTLVIRGEWNRGVATGRRYPSSIYRPRAHHRPLVFTRARWSTTFQINSIALCTVARLLDGTHRPSIFSYRDARISSKRSRTLCLPAWRITAFNRHHYSSRAPNISLLYLYPFLDTYFSTLSRKFIFIGNLLSTVTRRIVDWFCFTLTMITTVVIPLIFIGPFYPLVATSVYLLFSFFVQKPRPPLSNYQTIVWHGLMAWPVVAMMNDGSGTRDIRRDPTLQELFCHESSLRPGASLASNYAPGTMLTNRFPKLCRKTDGRNAARFLRSRRLFEFLSLIQLYGYKSFWVTLLRGKCDLCNSRAIKSRTTAITVFNWSLKICRNIEVSSCSIGRWHIRTKVSVSELTLQLLEG